MRLQLPDRLGPAMLLLAAILYPVETVLARLRVPWWVEAPCVLGVLVVWLLLIQPERE